MRIRVCTTVQQTFNLGSVAPLTRGQQIEIPLEGGKQTTPTAASAKPSAMSPFDVRDTPLPPDMAMSNNHAAVADLGLASAFFLGPLSHTSTWFGLFVMHGWCNCFSELSFSVFAAEVEP